jgi:LPS export ABC transporter protein LptC/lipopolysaccharide transport protein LptA
MPIRRRRPHLAWLRTLLLTALVLVLAAVVGLFLFGRAGRRAEQPSVAEDIAQATEGTTLVGRDFDYTYTEGERPLFRIRGDSIRADREQTIYLDGVGLTLYDQQGRAYQAESRVASFNRVRNEGELSGDVRLQGPSGLDFRSEVLQIGEKGRLLMAPKPVQIAFQGQYLVHAGTLRVQMNEELYVLSGDVEVRTVPGVSPPGLLRAQQLVYERPKRQVRVEGKAYLARGGDQLQAQRISAFLTDDEGALTWVRALWNVSGRTQANVQDQGRTRLRFACNDLGVLMEPGNAREPRQVEMDSPQRGGVTLEATGAGVRRVLTAKRVVGRMEQGVLNSASAFRGVELTESLGKAGERHVTGEQADAGFRPDGQFASLSLTGGVAYRDPDLTALGDRGQMDFDSGRGEFSGAPVDVQSKRGRMLAPHVVYTKSDGMLHSDGGVKATLVETEGTPIADSLPGQGEGPVRVDSREAFWRDQPRSFLFRGDVRAWRGESVLTARELRGDQEGSATDQGHVTATGGVKSLWIPVPAVSAGTSAGTPAKPPAKAPAGASTAAPAKPGASGASPRQPIEVTAAQLVYAPAPGAQKGQGRGLLTYSGDVRAEQEGRTILCAQLAVALGEKNRAETMTCTGNARVSDPVAGRNVTGERAVYHVADRLIEVFGDPVTMKDKDGNQVRGRQLLYHVEDGRVEVKGQGAPAAAAPAAGAAGAKGAGTGGR